LMYEACWDWSRGSWGRKGTAVPGCDETARPPLIACVWPMPDSGPSGSPSAPLACGWTAAISFLSWWMDPVPPSLPMGSALLEIDAVPIRLGEERVLSYGLPSGRAFVSDTEAGCGTKTLFSQADVMVEWSMATPTPRPSLPLYQPCSFLPMFRMDWRRAPGGRQAFTFGGRAVR